MTSKKDKDDFVTVRNVESRPDFVQIFGEAKVRICDAVLKELKSEYNRVYAELKKL